MKIIFLNALHGQITDPFREFINLHRLDADIFSLEEFTDKNTRDFSDLFRDFNPVYVQNTKNEGHTVFVKKNITIKSSEDFFLFEQSENDSGSFMKIEVEIDNKNVLIGSVEGKVRPGTKFDTDIRLKQSEFIINSFKNKNLPVIIGGDFNLLPDTKSIKMFEEAGYRDLIKDFKIKSTRNRITWESLKNDEGFVKQYYADYCFVSPDVKVNSFEVPDIEISDHLPLILEFDI